MESALSMASYDVQVAARGLRRVENIDFVSSWTLSVQLVVTDLQLKMFIDPNCNLWTIWCI